MKRTAPVIIILCFIIGIFAITLFIKKNLDYDASKNFKIKYYNVVITTRSLSATQKDKGMGNIQIKIDANSPIILESFFDKDLWNNYQPGYIKRTFKDRDFFTDLVIGVRKSHTEFTEYYISSMDGKLYAIKQ